MIGEFEDLLGCPRPVNTGQQAYVPPRRPAAPRPVGPAGGCAPPKAARLTVQETARSRSTTSATPAAASVPRRSTRRRGILRGDTEQDAPVICQLFGSTLPIGDDVLRLPVRRPRGVPRGVRGGDRHRRSSAGFVLGDDRKAVLAEARPDLIPD